jgi:hypothetical protein
VLPLPKHFRLFNKTVAGYFGWQVAQLILTQVSRFSENSGLDRDAATSFCPRLMP